MTDRELLELAAKAIGQELYWLDDWSPAIAGRLWNPLTDDGDALRLAVAAGLSVSITNYEAGAHSFRGYGYCELYSDHPDRGSATRRAIVRAAAEIGRSMP